MNQGDPPHPTGPHWRSIWQSTLHPRHKLLFWRILTGSLATKDHLLKFMPLPHSNCDICDQQEESLFHLLLECPLITAVWANSPWQLRLDGMVSPSLADWIQNVLRPKPLGLPDEIHLEHFLHFTAVAWETVWRFRNEVQHSPLQQDWGISVERSTSLLSRTGTRVSIVAPLFPVLHVMRGHRQELDG